MNFLENLKVIWRYWRIPQFLAADLLFFLFYFFRNPYRMHRYFLQKMGSEELYAYGETPITTFAELVQFAEITADDHVLELGCGRGRVSLWLATVCRCQVSGVEIHPAFVRSLKKIKSYLRLSRLSVYEGDFLEFDIHSLKSTPTVVYLYGTCLSEHQIKYLIGQFKSLKAGTGIVTVSYSLNEYDVSTCFRPLKKKRFHFPWGSADVYLQEVT